MVLPTIKQKPINNNPKFFVYFGKPKSGDCCIFYYTSGEPKKGNVYVLSFNGKTGLEFLKRIYSRSTVYLDRKKQKYNEYCRLYEESYR